MADVRASGARMFGRSIASLIGLVGGASILLAGGLSFLSTLIHGTAGLPESTWVGALVYSLAALFLGGSALFLSRPRLLWWRGRLLFNGVLLALVGAVAWLALGTSMLTVIGSVLAILAGILFALDSFVSRAPWRRLG